MASPNVSEIVATTIEQRSKKLADNVSKNTALLYKLKTRGKIKPADGGRLIREELSYAENKTYKRYSGFEVLDIQPQDVITAADFGWKQVAVAVTISGLEQMQNSGRSAFINLIDSRVTVAEASMMNGLSADLYSDGTADSGKQITGLQASVSATPTTGTYGTINAANFTFWRNQYATANYTKDTLVPAMDAMYASLVRNQDKPDLIPCDSKMWVLYVSALQAQQRFSNTDMADAGFGNIMFFQAPVVLDGGLGGSAPAGHMYFLNCKHIAWRPHTQRNMVPLGEERTSINQDATVKLIGFMGNLCTSNRSLQGLLVDSSP